ncbi:hypothetical protein PJI16_16275 [Nitrospira sp. MA-1]|nr:hypothetical protein [Nitrospira sp. MA-1]
MNGIDPSACKYALSKIDDGFAFESFVHSFLGGILGHTFLPAGGIKDKGIDGLDYMFQKENSDKVIYQYSIEKNAEGKATRTLELLRTNKINYTAFTYVTNQEVFNIERLVQDLIDKFKKPIQIYDLNWFASKVNNSPATVSAYEVFIKGYLHEFQKPGASFVIGDLISDPRLYVFLRQQWESKRDEIELDELLADTLILYALEGTDPDESKLKSREEILETISKHLKFEPKLLNAKIEARLQVLSSKPNRKIKCHVKENAYCLSFEARQDLVNKNFNDAALHQAFRDGVYSMLKVYLRTESVRVQDCVELIDGTLNKLFYRQGLEFSDLVSTGCSKDAFEKSLPETIAEVVDESKVIVKNRQAVKQALLITIRNIVYNGTVQQKEYLKCLANTYMLLFLLQCDPKISLFFATMAGRLEVYVCTSILIPALSEVCLEKPNRRYWNLLCGARDAGVKLKINEIILRELAAHFRKIRNIYISEYDGSEELYDDEMNIIYIREIMIRAYFHSRLRKQIGSFDEFIDKFCSPDLKNLEQDLMFWLKDTFGVEFIPEENSGITIDNGEFHRLEKALIEQGREKPKALTDAKLILTIFALREKNKEKSPESWSGYRTWWLSSDKLTQRTVNQIFEKKYSISCYMRPDFLYNYIALAPPTGVISKVYQHIFPNLLGVNISHNLPNDITVTVRKFIKEHQGKEKSRIKSTLCTLSDRLKSDPAYMSRAKVEHYFDEQKRILAQPNN